MSFVVCIMKNPVYEWTEENPVSNWDESQGDHHLDFDFNGKDFNALQTFLDIKLSPAEKGADFGDNLEQAKNAYISAAKKKGYEMLGRFWFYWDNVVFLPSEIARLRRECFKVKVKSQDADLMTAIDKILTACDDALETGSGIFFGCD